jgi:hypothetical protein
LTAGGTVTKPVTVVVKNQGDHTENIGVYLAILPPGGSSNPGGCSPSTVLNWVSFATGGAQSFLSNVPAGGRVSLKANVNWTCSNPSAVNGMNYTLRAIADHGNDDFASCNTLAAVFDGTCAAALADDDSVAGNNILPRPLPIVVAR